MRLNKTHRRETAAAMSGFSASTASRLEKDPRLPSEKKAQRGHGGGRPDPFADIWESEVVPTLERAPNLRPVTILHDLCLRYPERELMPARRTCGSSRPAYAWTIKYRGREDIRHVTTLAGLYDVLRVLELPGLAPPAFVTPGGDIPDHGHYTHNEGGSDEWSLTWTRIDDTPIVD